MERECYSRKVSSFIALKIPESSFGLKIGYALKDHSFRNIGIAGILLEDYAFLNDISPLKPSCSFINALSL